MYNVFSRPSKRSEDCRDYRIYGWAARQRYLHEARQALASHQELRNHCDKLLEFVASPQLLEDALWNVGRESLRAKTYEEPDNYWAWLRELGDKITAGTFRKGIYRRVEIPKPGKTGTRIIQIPPAATRIVARCLMNCLSPIFDPKFQNLSIGFRPKRSAFHGLIAAKLLAQQGYTHWVCCDIRDAFGQIPKQRLLQLVASRLYQSSVMPLIEELLDRQRKHGVPQGLAISPLMLNIYLDHNLDRYWAKNHTDTVLIRYADDILILCKTPGSAVHAYNYLKTRISDIGMRIKERQCDAIFNLESGQAADWLGFRIRHDSHEGLRFSLSEMSWDRLDLAFVHHANHIICDSDWTAYDSVAGWLAQKAPAIVEDQIPMVLDRVREMADSHGLVVSELSEALASEALERGNRFMTYAQADVQKWLQPILPSQPPPSAESDQTLHLNWWLLNMAPWDQN
jgi:retron-type reverse transcriptase